MMRIAFHSFQMGQRGTEICLHKYAKYNREILGNQSVIISSIAHPTYCLDRFKDFDVILYPEYWIGDGRNDVLRNKFAGAESVFKITSSCQTHASRSRKYLPSTSYVGGKTGTWNNQYTHDSAWFNIGNNWYAISVFSDGSDTSETLALLFGGLCKEYCK